MGLLSKLFAAKRKQPPLIVEQRAWVMVYDVPTADWQSQDDERAGDDFAVRVLKLTRDDARLTLLAKDYTGAAPETLAEIEAGLAAQYAAIFEITTSVQRQHGKLLLMDRTVPALDVVADGTTDGEAWRIRERYTTTSGHKLIIAAIGTAAEHEQFAGDIDRWFRGIAFRVDTSRS